MKTININFLISGTKILIPFKAVCSVTDKVFQGIVEIEYKPKKKVVEYVDMERVVNKVTKGKLTAEELADRVFKEVKTSISPKYLKIFVDVHKSEAHRPVQVWIEKKFR